jgi:hypothetical protein
MMMAVQVAVVMMTVVMMTMVIMVVSAPPILRIRSIG